MVVPGIAGRETIRRNHARVVDPQGTGLHPACREGNLQDNPVWQDLADGARRVGPVYSLQLALAAGERIADCRGGLLEETQRRLLPAVARCEGAPRGAPADVVVASAGGHPADIDLVQAHKAIHHAFQALRPGGAMVVLAECAGGIGSATLPEWLALDSLEALAARLRGDYQLNGHTALAMRQKSAAARIVLVSALAPEAVRRTGMHPAASLDEAWQRLHARDASFARGTIIPDAAATVPLSDKEES
jgi:nickel-dependent lactate racemase